MILDKWSKNPILRLYAISWCFKAIEVFELDNPKAKEQIEFHNVYDEQVEKNAEYWMKLRCLLS
jgi:hypothetical protein